jgi:hypothetical protein
MNQPWICIINARRARASNKMVNFPKIKVPMNGKNCLFKTKCYIYIFFHQITKQETPTPRSQEKMNGAQKKTREHKVKRKTKPNHKAQKVLQNVRSRYVQRRERKKKKINS